MTTDELKAVSTYSGSPVTRASVGQQILMRFGEEAAKNYDPYTNCMTARQWALRRQMKIKKGEVSLKSTSLLDLTDKKTGETKKVVRKIHLFAENQVEPFKSK
jgi:hypothetical protein